MTDQPHHAAGRQATPEGEAAAMAAAARRQLGLPDPGDSDGPYPDDPEKAARHRAALDRLRDSLAAQIARDAERRAG